MKINAVNRFTELTHEGTQAHRINAEQMLRRSLMSCMLWEKEFYEDGETIAKRIADLIPLVDPTKVANMAIEARNRFYLRHAPLLVVREMARHPQHKAFVSNVLYNVIQRADELAEFVAIYWGGGRQPLSAQVKKGLASAFTKFNAYSLAKYNRDGAVKLRDVLFLCHAKPKDDEQKETWKQLVDGTLPTPDTWEVALASGADKKETWERLLSENKLGGLALLRNLRNMNEVKVDTVKIFSALSEMKTDKILPYRFIAAAKVVPQWEDKIEQVMLRCISEKEKIPGKTVLLVDVSGSMSDAISAKSDLTRIDAASGLAILCRELCEDGAIFTFSNNLVNIPPRHGFALRDAINDSQQHGGTELGKAVTLINDLVEYDRIIVITDEQSSDRVPDPTGKGYVINVASNKNGIGYGAWTHVDGFSEAVLDYITVAEQEDK